MRAGCVVSAEATSSCVACAPAVPERSTAPRRFLIDASRCSSRLRRSEYDEDGAAEPALFFEPTMSPTIPPTNAPTMASLIPPTEAPTINPTISPMNHMARPSKCQIESAPAAAQCADGGLHRIRRNGCSRHGYGHSQPNLRQHPAAKGFGHRGTALAAEE